MKQKSNTRKKQAAATKKKIYESAVKLMREKGLDNFTVDEVVDIAGVSKGTFYVHFKSKYSLIAEHVIAVDKDYESFYRSMPDYMKTSEKLMVFADKIADVMINDVGYGTMRTIYEVALKKADGTGAILSTNRKLNTIFKEIIVLGIERNEFREDIDADLAANHLVMGIRGMTFHWCANHPAFDLKKNVAFLFEIMISGICKK